MSILIDAQSLAPRAIAPPFGPLLVARCGVLWRKERNQQPTRIHASSRQAIVERIPIVSVDAALERYGVERIW